LRLVKESASDSDSLEFSRNDARARLAGYSDRRAAPPAAARIGGLHLWTTGAAPSSAVTVYDRKRIEDCRGPIRGKAAAARLRHDTAHPGAIPTARHAPKNSPSPIAFRSPMRRRILAAAAAAAVREGQQATASAQQPPALFVAALLV
jgi:hypothetical protein